MFIKKKKLGDDLISYMIGDYSTGIQLVLRNVGDSKSEFTRRYIRLIVSICDYRMTFEFRFRNSI